eukprot:3481068-Rhodomonas_salina.1
MGSRLGGDCCCSARHPTAPLRAPHSHACSSKVFPASVQQHQTAACPTLTHSGPPSTLHLPLRVDANHTFALRGCLEVKPQPSRALPLSAHTPLRTHSTVEG